MAGDQTHPTEPAGSDHCLQRGRIRLAPNVYVDKSDLAWSFMRSSGPGGQSVNKLNTKVELRLPLTAICGLDENALARLRDQAGSRLTQDDVIVMHCDESRSQRRNRRKALDRMRELVERATVAPRRRKRKRPSRAAVERRLKRKRQQAEKKERRGWRPPAQ